MTEKYDWNRAGSPLPIPANIKEILNPPKPQPPVILPSRKEG